MTAVSGDGLTFYGTQILEFVVNPSFPNQKEESFQAVVFDGSVAAIESTVQVLPSGSVEPLLNVGRWNVALTNLGSGGPDPDDFSADVTADGTMIAGWAYAPGSSQPAGWIADLRPALVVNSVGDQVDQTPGDGICDTGQPHMGDVADCTLHAAIQETKTTAERTRAHFDIASNRRRIPGDRDRIEAADDHTADSYER